MCTSFPLSSSLDRSILPRCTSVFIVPVQFLGSITVPANYHIIDGKVLANLENGGVLVDTARGAVINTPAPVSELSKQRVWGALDVFEEEPLPEDSPLRGPENCQLVPHMDSPTADRRVDMGKLAVENITRHFRSEEPLNRVSPKRYDLHHLSPAGPVYLRSAEGVTASKRPHWGGRQGNWVPAPQVGNSTPSSPG